MDFVVVGALPVIDRDLHIATVTRRLVVAAYGIACGVPLVLGGGLGDAYGRRRVFVLGLVLFTLTSLGCGLAPTAEVFVAVRAPRGAAAALMVPRVLATIRRGDDAGAAVPRRRLVRRGAGAVRDRRAGARRSPRRRGRRGPRPAPVFLVNVPLGLAGLVLARHAMPETRASRPVTVDRAGTPLLSGVVLVSLLPLVEGPVLGRPVWTWLLLAATPVLAAAFVVTQRRSERDGRPPLPPPVLGTPSMRHGQGAVVLGAGVLIATTLSRWADLARWPVRSWSWWRAVACRTPDLSRRGRGPAGAAVSGAAVSR